MCMVQSKHFINVSSYANLYPACLQIHSLPSLCSEAYPERTEAIGLCFQGSYACCLLAGFRPLEALQKIRERTKLRYQEFSLPLSAFLLTPFSLSFLWEIKNSRSVTFIFRSLRSLKLTSRCLSCPLVDVTSFIRPWTHTGGIHILSSPLKVSGYIPKLGIESQGNQGHGSFSAPEASSGTFLVHVC